MVFDIFFDVKPQSTGKGIRTHFLGEGLDGDANRAGHRLGRAGKTGKLIVIRIHLVTKRILAAEFEFDV